MGPNSALRITSMWSFTANTNTKTIRINFGGTLIIQSSYPTAGVGVVQLETIIRNRGATNAQSWVGGGYFGFSTATAVATAAIDTTADQALTFSAQCGVATDTITLEGYIVEIIG
jgi:hypothetical protein